MELAGDVQKEVGGDKMRLFLCGLDAFARLGEVSFEGIHRKRAILGSIGKGEAGPRGKFDSIDNSKPGGIYREAGDSMEVTDKCSNTGEITGIEIRGGRVPFCWNGGMG